MQFGVSANTAAAQLRKPDKIIINQTCKAGTRDIGSRVPVRHILQDRHHKNDRDDKLLERYRQEWNAESVQEVLSRAHPEAMFKQPAVPKALDKETDKKNDKASTNIRLTPTRILTYLGDPLDLEKEELAFAYLSTNKIVFQTFQAIKEACAPTVKDQFQTGSCDKKWETPFIARQILILAPKMEVLESAAEVFKLTAPSFGSASRELDKLIGRDYDVEKKGNELAKS